jgi:hypothetical protein
MMACALSLSPFKNGPCDSFIGRPLASNGSRGQSAFPIHERKATQIHESVQTPLAIDQWHEWMRRSMGSRDRLRSIAPRSWLGRRRSVCGRVGVGILFTVAKTVSPPHTHTRFCSHPPTPTPADAQLPPRFTPAALFAFLRCWTWVLFMGRRSIICPDTPPHDTTAGGGPCAVVVWGHEPPPHPPPPPCFRWVDLMRRPWGRHCFVSVTPQSTHALTLTH